MTRRAEWTTLVTASGLAAFGVSLVNFANGGGIDVQVGLTFLVFLIAFGTVATAVHIWAPKATPLLLPSVVAVTAIGFLEIFRLDPIRAGLQRWWLLIGAALASVVLWLLASRGTSVLRRYRNLILLVSVTLLVAPNLPSDWGFPIRGMEVNGSRLWVTIDLGFINVGFQPGELAKLGLVVFMAAYLADHQKALREAHRRVGPFRFPEPRQLIPLLLAWGASVLILVWQRDLGASLLLFAGFVLLLYAATGASGYLVSGAVLALLAGFTAYQAFDHVQRRVIGWLAPFDHFADEGYQIAQGLFALGSGSLSGAGPGLGRPDLIPNAATDFIFAAVGEELGFAASVAVIALYSLLVAVGIGIAFRSRSTFRKLLAAGLTLVFGVQVFLIVGGILRLVPLTGITLPFMSYGGSALVGNLVLVALLLRISHEEAG
ncbi:MAG: FtsW/RodA/SpoVE family cell cycle protein [Actinobacteria bacterium]|nr:FtsW/RodA/SpoVE family cell cycle protein [Actinomycetota bacterium]MCI0545370.1 FtsW/RodA/SpoVE family cell cycle protein [Actinomycetota bacterium]MCI0678105.1 FtsW/RodA/SpoVE family cell cycle protein [Actinomycetota bacterium]